MSSQQSEGRVQRKRPQTNSADGGGSQGIRNRTDTLPGSKMKKISTDAQLRHRKSSTCSPTVSPNPSSIANTAQNPCPLQTDLMNTSATTTNTVEGTAPTTPPCSNPNSSNSSSSICSSTMTTSSSMEAAFSSSEKPSKLGRATEPGGGGGSPPRKQPHLATTTTVSEPDQHHQQPVRKNLIQKLIEIDRLSDLINLRGLRIRSTEASAAERLRQIEFVSPDYLGADLEHVEVMQRKFDEFLKELKSHESRVLDINREANTLIDEGHPGQQQIRQKRDEVNEEWHKLGGIRNRTDTLAGYKVKKISTDAQALVHQHHQKQQRQQTSPKVKHVAGGLPSDVEMTCAGSIVDAAMPPITTTSAGGGAGIVVSSPSSMMAHFQRMDSQQKREYFKRHNQNTIQDELDVAWSLPESSRTTPPGAADIVVPTSSSSMAPPLPPTILFKDLRAFQLNSLEARDVETVKAAFLLMYEEFRKNGSNMMCSFKDTSDLMFLLDTMMRRLVKVTKKLPAFNELSHSGRFSLLKVAMIDMLTVRGALSVDTKNECWKRALMSSSNSNEIRLNFNILD